MTDIIITLDDLIARQGLQEIERKLHNLRPAFASMGEYLLRKTDDNFRGEHDPDGVAWAPLSEAYRKRKRGTKILTESGRLRMVNYYADGKQVVVGCNTKYARAHQYGYPKRNLPARPFIGVSEKDEEVIGEILIDYLQM